MDKETKAAWQEIDKGLHDLMAKNDELSDDALVARCKRLRHLGKFTERLAMRISERLRENTKPGSIQELFAQYKLERSQIDQN